MAMTSTATTKTAQKMTDDNENDDDNHGSISGHGSSDYNNSTMTKQYRQ